MRHLNELIDDHDLNIILRQELKIHHDSNKKINVNQKKHFPDFEFYSNDGTETGILINSKMQHQEICDLKNRIGRNKWTTWVMVCNGKNIAVAFYYRSPSEDGNINKVVTELEQIKKIYKTETRIIGGDFNAHSGIWDARFDGSHDQVTENVIKFMDDQNLACINDNYKPTHVRTRDRSSDNIVDILRYNSVDIVLITQDLIRMYAGWTTNSHNTFNGDIDHENIANCEIDSDWVSNMSSFCNDMEN